MNKNINLKEAATVNQISNTKPKAPYTTNVPLVGDIGGSMNGGVNHVITCIPIMKNQGIKEYGINAKFHMLTPKTPAFQKLNITFDAYFVPDTAVYDAAEEFQSQKGGTTKEKIKKLPNFNGQSEEAFQLNTLTNKDTGQYIVMIQNSTLWRNCFVSSYLPRISSKYGIIDQGSTEIKYYFPFFEGINAIPLRGYVSIYNNFLRNKEYEEEIPEFKGQTVTQAEVLNYQPNFTATENGRDGDYYQGRAKMPNSYYSNYRTELQGEETDLNDIFELNTNAQLMNWANVESRINEYRAQAENAQMNDWDVIAKLYGGKPAVEGKPQHIGRVTSALNYSSVTQSAYNTNEQIAEKYRVMGTQGAYSYTEFKNLPIVIGKKFNEAGHLHIFATVWAETVYENAFDRRLHLNITPESQYRPDLQKEKLDVLYKIETGSQYITSINNYQEIIGFKRKYSEYYKLNNTLQGDVLSDKYFEAVGITSTNEIDLGNVGAYYGDPVDTQATYQFYENENGGIADITGANTTIQVNKKIWKDYTDLHINKNQAIQNQIAKYKDCIFIRGQNQIFYIGKHYMIADLPISNEAENNKTNWGEH